MLTVSPSKYANTSTKKTKLLSQLTTKLNRLNSNQKKALKQKSDLSSELKDIDLKLAAVAHKLQNLDLDIQHKQQTIQNIQDQLAPLQKKFEQHQKLLSHYLVLHYQLGQAQPLALILNQRDPALTSRLMTYIAYINKNRTQLLKNLKSLGNDLSEQNKLEQQQLNTLEKLIAEEREAKEQYQADKILQKDIIQNIANQIDARAKKINQLEDNKQKLEKILQKVSSLQQTAKISFASLKHKLPWPTDGKISQHKGSTNNELPFNGIYIQANEGRQVSAVHSGKVVFSDWLRGYGLLIIIQHDHGFMTLYANNQALYREKGDWVYSGQKIATVGHSGGQLEDGLYFELRRNGKPLAPLKWLKR